MSDKDAKQKAINDQRERKTRQGMFFVSLSLGATTVVMVMLLFLLGLMLYRGSSRLFYSPTFTLTHVDGSVSQTDLNQNVEFDALDELNNVIPKSPLQAAKQYTNSKIEALTYSQAPVPEGTVVEVWGDEVVEVKDPWASEADEAPKIKQVVQKKRESIAGATDVRFDMEKDIYKLGLSDGKIRDFPPKTNLQFRQSTSLFNMRTLVTRYLQNNPEEAQRRREAAKESLTNNAHGSYLVDPRWKVFLKAHVERESNGQKYMAEDRVKQFPAVVSFTVQDKWNWFQFFWDFPRSGNTEGGVLPCIFGTVLMTLIMTVIVAPFGIATAVYLMEYARDTWFTHFVRLSVANLAGVPSIVFGLFGLGFFVLTVGQGIDNAAYGGAKVFGTPCVLWASLTMALLTLPVMIVATEEALRTVPRELREGALALGATKFATIMGVVIPTALPGILTGVILAVARGAGEVAPLLLTGVVAHKDQLPFNPLEKFMNLAYHIYDLSVKSQPNKIEEAQSLAFSAALVLVLVVLVMNLLAVMLRAKVARNRSL
jgi:phosphate ABC transporter permease subunit PstA